MPVCEPINNNCAECGEYVAKGERQQVFFYDKFNGFKRVCGKCLLKLKPSDK